MNAKPNGGAKSRISRRKLTPTSLLRASLSARPSGAKAPYTTGRIESALAVVRDERWRGQPSRGAPQRGSNDDRRRQDEALRAPCLGRDRIVPRWLPHPHD